MFLLILIMWVVIVFCLKIAIFGNPLNHFVRKQTPVFLEHLDNRMQNRLIPDNLNDEEAEFVRRFSRLAILELSLFLLEIAILGFLILIWQFENPFFFWLSIALLTKNVMAFTISWLYSRSLREEQGIFRHLLRLPPWINLMDRVSSAVSASVLLVLMVKIAGIWTGNGNL